MILRRKQEEREESEPEYNSRGQPSFNCDPFRAKQINTEVCFQINLHGEHDSYTLYNHSK